MIIDVKFEENDLNLDVQFENLHIVEVIADPYEGDYEITPSQEQQILQTAKKNLSENITINPIPKEYGRVTYDHNKKITIT